MTVLIAGKNSFYLSAPAVVVDDSRDLAASWASDHIKPNPGVKWILGKYVEADKANRNGQMWSFEDLQMSRPTVVNSPMNVNHQRRRIVGSFVAAEMMYPIEENSQELEVHPYIEALGAFWKHYFPEELLLVERAFDEGSLWLSMECVADSVTCISGCGREFAYEGPFAPSYCSHINEGGIKQLNRPTFLGGALILPPNRPGWADADVKDISKLIKDNIETAEQVHDAIRDESPSLKPDQWEWLMAELMVRARG
jgi:hypothetical protein